MITIMGDRPGRENFFPAFCARPLHAHVAETTLGGHTRCCWLPTKLPETWWTSRNGPTLLLNGPPRALASSSTMCSFACLHSSSLAHFSPGSSRSTLRLKRSARNRGPRKKPMWPRQGVPRLTDYSSQGLPQPT